MAGRAQQLRPACACCPCRRVEIRVRDLPRDKPLEDWFTVEVGVQPWCTAADVHAMSCHVRSLFDY